MLFTPDGQDRIVARQSPTGQLIERMEKEWYACFDACPEEIRSLPPDNVEILKRMFMVGFSQGAQWAQSKGSN